MEQKQYRLCTPDQEFWKALLQIRNYLLGDMVFAIYALHHKEHPIAEAFWVLDRWLNAALPVDDEYYLGS